MSWTVGRSSLVGTTVSAADRLPRHLVADEKHTTLAGKKVYLAATTGGGCCLGLALAKTAGNDDLETAYGVFRDEAQHLDPKYRPETVNTDGWPATQAAWRSLFKGITIILCFLHAFLKIRDRAVHLKETFAELSRRVWEAYHAPDAGSFSQRLRRLRPRPTWTRGSCGRRSWRCVTSEQPSSRRMPTPAAIGRASWWTGCCGDWTTTCTAANISTAVWESPSRVCEAGR